jgi:hypothetical protein
VVRWTGGKVSTVASIAARGRLSGAKLRDAYAEAVPALTLGLAVFRDNAVVVGPFTVLRFGEPALTRTSVEWPIEGGLLAGASGGTWRIHAARGHVEATVTAFQPSLPRPVYAVTHLQVHELFTRLFLLRLRGREPSLGVAPAAEDRIRAASVDLAFCLTLARLGGRRRVTRTLAVAAAYHVVCWSLWGRTFGGLVMRQRVVATDGSRPTLQQSALRLALLPLSWLSRRPLHDEVAQTEVITG